MTEIIFGIITAIVGAIQLMLGYGQLQLRRENEKLKQDA